MKFRGSYYFDAEQDVVWNLMTNPQAIAAASPGVEEMIPINGEEDAWRTKATIRGGMINGSYSGTLHITERNPNESYRLTISGEGNRTIVNGTALITLSYDEGLEQTIVQWDGNADISGELARIGQPIFQAAATMVTKQFFRTLAKQKPSL
jgi:carbon monoxide dehydrogenase subunit G